MKRFSVKGAQVMACVWFSGFAFASSQETPPNPIPEVIPQTLIDGVLNDARSSVFAGVLRTSRLTHEDLNAGDITFVIPRDGSCSGAQVASLRALTEVDARRYILGHTFKGQLAVLAENGRVTRMNYFPKTGMEGRQTIDEAHSVSVQLLDGRTLTLELMQGQMYVNGHVPVEGNHVMGGPGGTAIPISQCNPL